MHSMHTVVAEYSVVLPHGCCKAGARCGVARCTKQPLPDVNAPQSIGECVECSFRGAVVAHERHGPVARDAAHVDNGAAARGNHGGGKRLGDCHCAKVVDIEQRLGLVNGDVLCSVWARWAPVNPLVNPLSGRQCARVPEPARLRTGPGQKAGCNAAVPGRSPR